MQLTMETAGLVQYLIGWALVLLLAGVVALVLRRFGAPGQDRGEQRPHCAHCSVADAAREPR